MTRAIEENEGRAGANEDDVHTQFNNFWGGLVCNEDGTLNEMAVKRELFDYHFVMGEVGKVYCEITNDRLSKPNYHADTVIRVAQDIQSEMVRDAEKAVYDEAIDALMTCSGSEAAVFWMREAADLVRYLRKEAFPYDSLKESEDPHD